MIDEYDKSLKSYFLVANTTLRKSYFSDSVILIVEHNELGALGLVLNRINPKKEVLHQFTGSMNKQRVQNIPLYEGGPVDQRSIFIIHSDPTIKTSSKEVLPGIFLGSSLNLFQDLLKVACSFNVYQGYAGWSAGQLEQEVQSKSWIVLPASIDIIFNSEPDMVWKEVLRVHGGLYSYFAEKVHDPILN